MSGALNKEAYNRLLKVQMFTKWKESKEGVLKDAIRRKVKEKIKKENAEKNEGRQKKEEAEKLFEAW